MDIRILGPVEAWEGGRRVDLAGPRQRMVLALLAVNANRVVDASRLVEDLWRGTPPSTARKTLQAYVSRLRKALADGAGVALETRPPGYVLRVEPASLDALRFEELVGEGRAVLPRSASGASELLRAALATWRGPALHDLSSEPALQPEIQRLEEMRLTALEDRIEADLALGRDADLIGELEALATLHPLRERFTAQLMLAQYRSGRQADALRAFASLRRVLLDELGLDPSPELQALEQRILDQDPELLRPETAPDAAPAGPVMRGFELREEIDSDRWGVRYRGYQAASGWEVVVKVVHRALADHPEFIRRLDQEVRSLGRIHHPAVGSLVDAWRDAEGAYLVWPWPGAGSLEDRLALGRLLPEEAMDVLGRLADGLAAVHGQGVVHGNLRPATVLIDPDGNPQLSDFGVVHDLTGPRPATAEDDVRDLARLAVDLVGGETARYPAPIREVLAEVQRVAHPDPAVLLAPLRRAAPRSISRRRNPFKGLRPFLEADATDFFGREPVVEDLLARLGRPGLDGRLVTVVGPSGSGKSSVVQGGLAPALASGRVPGSERWFVARMAPGTRPFEELEAALQRVAVNPPPALLEQLLDGELGLHRALLRTLPDDGFELLLVVDQLEELFMGEQSVADAFLDALAAAVSSPGARLRVVATLRADFYDRPLLHPAFGAILPGRVVTLGGLSPPALERAIVGPAEQVGAAVEPALVAQIVADVADQPAALPLLQYALTELFDRTDGNLLSLQRYREIGSVDGALVARAEALYRQLGPAAQDAVRQVFLRMVTIVEGREVSRRRVLRSELVAMRVDRAAVEEALDTFGRARLLTFDRDRVSRGPTVEVAHEALLHRWDRLAGWIETARADLVMHRRLAAAAEEWAARGGDPEYLLLGTRLAEIAEWERGADVALTRSEGEFLEASLLRQEEAAQSEGRRLDHERRLEHRANLRLRLLVAVMAGAAVLGMTLTLVALDRAAEARSQAARAEAAGLAGAAVANTDRDAQLGLNLALAGARVAVDGGLPLPSEVEQALHLTIQAAGIPYPGPAGEVALIPAPGGTRGVFRMSPQALVDLAAGGVARPLSQDECRLYLPRRPCLPFPGEGLEIDQEDSTLAVSSADAPLAGTRVSLVGWYDNDAHPSWRSLREFEQDTGAFLQIDGLPAVEEGEPDYVGAATSGWGEAGLGPDVAVVPPNWVPRLAVTPGLMEPLRYLDAGRIEADFAPYLRALGSVGDDGAWPDPGGSLLALPIDLSSKSVIWYPVRGFREAGYRPPSTWDELSALTAAMRADGHTPWCMGEESGEADGWPATDWVEDILLHRSGPDLYDRWVAHDVPFDHPEVVEAARILAGIYFEEGNVAGGASGAVSRSFWEAGEMLLEDPPACWLYHMPIWSMHALESPEAIGRDVSAFPFPPFDDRWDDVVLGGANYLVVLRDRPEVRELVRFLASPAWGEAWAETPGADPFGPANLRFEPSRFDDDLFRLLALELRVALRADRFRHDGSDLMPVEVGGGSFWRGMVDLLSSSPDDVDRVFSGIEDGWPSAPGG